MSGLFFRSDLGTVAIYWRIERVDGVTLGFTSHDRDLTFDGVRYRTAPGMVPSAIRRTASLEPDDAEVQGALSHDAIGPDDLAAGRFDSARVQIGLVNWDTLERLPLFSGDLGMVSTDGTTFEAALRSAKSDLEQDLVPRTSPTCRARFCGPGCALSPHRFTHEGVVLAVDPISGLVSFASGTPPLNFAEGFVRWIDGPHAGLEMEVIDASDGGLLLEVSLSADVIPGQRALLREGCDHTLATCDTRFGNAANFQGEPFLPGNDAILRYPTSSS